jgi:hypothetical protein
MRTKIKIAMPCSEAYYICDKCEYQESSIWEKIKLSIHTFYCITCRNYVKTNKKLSFLISKSKVTCLDRKNKEYLKINFEKALKASELNKN